MAKSRCEQCEHYLELKTPFHYELEGYPNGVIIYGFCAKNGRSRVNTYHPVYIPDGGVCQSFSERKETEKA